jgi:predicted ATPase
MRIATLRIENFKGLASQEIDLRPTPSGEPRPFTLLLGDNGSGKTTVLQAIALVLSLATRRTEEPMSFRWPGFLAERVGSLGRTRVEIEVTFEADEIAATQELADLYARTAKQGEVALPSDAKQVTLIFDESGLHSPGGPAALAQLWGRWFVRMRLRAHPHLRDAMARVGDVFWFGQNRDLYTAGDARDDAEGLAQGGPVGIDRLRDFLVGWWAFHTSPEQTRGRGVDYLALLEERFAELFPGTSFVGVAPREYASLSRATDSYFLLRRGEKVYDLAEMSSGEQAIFPLLYQFVRLGIARSIVLIDELELHLHPPEQQALRHALRRLGPDCQFIVTSHSPYLEGITPDEDEVRLSGGRPCL